MHMNINATLMGQFILLLMIIVGVVAWRLARRKSEHPVLITVLCMLLSLAPPFAGAAYSGALAGSPGQNVRLADMLKAP